MSKALFQRNCGRVVRIFTLCPFHCTLLGFCSPLLNARSSPPPLPQPGHVYQGLAEDHDPCDPDRLRAGSLPARPAGGVDGAAGLPLEAAGTRRRSDDPEILGSRSSVSPLLPQGSFSGPAKNLIGSQRRSASFRRCGSERRDYSELGM